MACNKVGRQDRQSDEGFSWIGFEITQICCIPRSGQLYYYSYLSFLVKTVYHPPPENKWNYTTPKITPPSPSNTKCTDFFQAESAISAWGLDSFSVSWGAWGFKSLGEAHLVAAVMQ